MTIKLPRMTKFTLNTCFITPFLIAITACGSSGDGGIAGTGDPTIVGDTSGQTATPDNSNTQSLASVTPGDNSGELETATPEFQWQAVEGADTYQVQITEREGNRITYNTGINACNGDDCAATPTAAFHNNDITWQVDALGNGQVLQSSAAGTYTTPLSLDLTPEVTNPECEVWPAINNGNITLLNNIWNNGVMFSDQWTQGISAQESEDGTTIPSWNYNWLSETDGPRSAVKAYPQILYGNKIGTHVSADSSVTGLPATASSLPEFSIDLAYTETFNGQVERNVALESFFHDTCDIKGVCHLGLDNRAYEMMVWIANPDSNKPGDLAETAVDIDGRKWDVYIKPNSNKQYIAFTANEPFSEGIINWNRFVEWTINWTTANSETLSINPLTPDLCMGAIEMGTEIWWGEGSFTLDKFVVTKN